MSTTMMGSSANTFREVAAFGSTDWRTWEEHKDLTRDQPDGERKEMVPAFHTYWGAFGCIFRDLSLSWLKKRGLGEEESTSSNIRHTGSELGPKESEWLTIVLGRSAYTFLTNWRKRVIWRVGEGRREVGCRVTIHMNGNCWITDTLQYSQDLSPDSIVNVECYIHEQWATPTPKALLNLSPTHLSYLAPPTPKAPHTCYLASPTPKAKPTRYLAPLTPNAQLNL